MLRKVGLKSCAYYNGPYRASKSAKSQVLFSRTMPRLKTSDFWLLSSFKHSSNAQTEEYSTRYLRIFPTRGKPSRGEPGKFAYSWLNAKWQDIRKRNKLSLYAPSIRASYVPTFNAFLDQLFSLYFRHLGLRGGPFRLAENGRQTCAFSRLSGGGYYRQPWWSGNTGTLHNLPSGRGAARSGLGTSGHCPPQY